MGSDTQPERPIATGFRVALDYPQAVRAFIAAESRRSQLDASGHARDTIFAFADEAAICFELSEGIGYGEESGAVFIMVGMLITGVPGLLAGESIHVQGFYGSYCFVPDHGQETVYMSRHWHPWDYELEEELDAEEGIADGRVEETVWYESDPQDPAKKVEWRRLEIPIPLARFVEQCLAAASTVIEVYRAECPPEVFASAQIQAMVTDQARARDAWEAFRRRRSAM